jgi:adenylate cyclase
MGDGVNLAARLEGLNKVYGTTILVSESIRAAVAQEGFEGFVFREVDRVAVKGKSRAITIHELRGERPPGGAAEEEVDDVVRTYEAALHAAQARSFEQALELLARPECQADGPSAVLAARCRSWAGTPPPADWDGTWVATSK